MQKFYITGASRGIGHALAETLLKDEENQVVGISRTNTLVHNRYMHIPLDFEDVREVATVADGIFKKEQDVEQVVLINNAGYLGNIQYLGEIDHSEFIRVMNINITSPAILMNAFIRQLKGVNGKKIILNIASGAGRHPYDGWGAYCASKAAIDMLSSVADMENEIRNGDFRIISLAPGPVETDMQEIVRSTDIENFSQKNKFISLKDSGKLLSSQEVAEKILTFIDGIEQVQSPIQDIRDIDIN